MYELKCPTCGHMVKLSFVRIGAVVTCEHCEQRYTVRDAHVKHKVSAPAAKSRSAEDISKPDADAPDSAQRDAEGKVIGLSGLSEMMGKAGPAKPRAKTNPPPKANAPRTPPPDEQPAPPAAAARAPWQNIRPMYLAFGGLLTIIVILGAGIFIISSGLRSKDADDTTIERHPSSTNARPPFATLLEPLLIDAEPLADPSADVLELTGAPRDAVRLNDNDVWIESVDNRGTLRVDAVNRTGRRCEQFLFVITAVQTTTPVESRWIVRVNEPLDPDEGIAFITTLNVTTTDDVVSWRIDAAGW